MRTILTLVAILGVIWFVISCWQYILAIALVGFMAWAMLRTAVGLLANAGGGQLLKGLLVVAALILAAPPFWPISIPLAACLVLGCLALAPISLLFSAISDFMDR